MNKEEKEEAKRQKKLFLFFNCLIIAIVVILLSIYAILVFFLGFETATYIAGVGLVLLDIIANIIIFIVKPKK